jgi:hypothetical protein
MCLIWLDQGLGTKIGCGALSTTSTIFSTDVELPDTFPKRYPLTLHHISNKSAVGPERIENGGSDATAQINLVMATVREGRCSWPLQRQSFPE